MLDDARDGRPRLRLRDYQHASHEAPEAVACQLRRLSRLKFLVVAPAEPLRQFEEGKPREAWAPRTDANGEVLWRVQLVALGDGGRRSSAWPCRAIRTSARARWSLSTG
jgi:hypothetical protein